MAKYDGSKEDFDEWRHSGEFDKAISFAAKTGTMPEMIATLREVYQEECRRRYRIESREGMPSIPFLREKELTISIEPTDKTRKRNLEYIGKDGRYYPTSEGLIEANERWARTHLQYIGKDGQRYSTPEALQEANERWRRTHLTKLLKNKSRGGKLRCQNF